MSDKDPTRPSSDKATGRRLAPRALMAAFAVALIVASAFVLHRTSRADQLQRQYSRQAARLGRQTELNVESYLRVARSLLELQARSPALDQGELIADAVSYSDALGRLRAELHRADRRENARSNADATLLANRLRLLELAASQPSGARLWDWIPDLLARRLRRSVLDASPRAEVGNPLLIQARDAVEKARAGVWLSVLARRAAELDLVDAEVAGHLAARDLVRTTAAPEDNPLRRAAIDEAGGALLTLRFEELARRAMQASVAEATERLDELRTSLEPQWGFRDVATADDAPPPDAEDRAATRDIHPRVMRLLSSASAEPEETSRFTRFLVALAQGSPPSQRLGLHRCLVAEPPARFSCLREHVLTSLIRVGVGHGDGQQQVDFVRCSTPRERATRAARVSTDRKAVLVTAFVAIDDEDGRSTDACLRVPFARLFPAVSRYEGSRVLGDAPPVEAVLATGDGTVLQQSEGSWFRVNDLAPQLPDLFGGERTQVAESAVKSIELGPHGYRVFVQPVVPRLDGSCTAGSPGCHDAAEPETDGDIAMPGMAVALLVPTDRIDAESVSIRLVVFLWAAFFIAIGVGLVPFVKSWSLGPRSRFKRVDAASIVAAAGIAGVLCTTSASTVVADLGLRTRTERQLRAVTEAVASRVDGVVCEADGFLRALEAETEQLRQGRITCEAWDPAEALRRSVGAFECGGELVLPLEESSRTRSPRNAPEYCEKTRVPLGDASGWVREASWIDAEDGQQHVKITAEATATLPLQLTHRPYYRRALAAAPEAPPSVEVVRSAGTRELILAAARRTGHADSPSGVALVSREIDFLRDLALPSEVTFAVVDASGTVMFHSANASQHGHQLLDNVEDEQVLRDLMRSGVDQAATFRYLSVMSRAYVRYLPKSQWYVLALTPVELVDRAITAMVIITLFHVVLFGASLGMLVAIVSFWRTFWFGRSARTWLAVLRPSVRFLPIYRRWSGLGVGVTVITVICATVAPGHLTAAVFCTLAIAGSWLGFALDGSPTTSRPAHRSRVGRWFTLGCIGWMGMFFMAPTSVLYALAYDDVVTNMVRAEQDHCAQARGDGVPGLCGVSTVHGPRPRDPTSLATAGVVSPSAPPRDPEVPIRSPNHRDSLLVRWLPPRLDLGGSLNEATVDTYPRPLRFWVRPSQTLLEMWRRTDDDHDSGTVAARDVLPQPYAIDFDHHMAVCWTYLALLMAISTFAIFVFHVSVRRLFFLAELETLAPTRTPPAPAARGRTAERVWADATPDEKYVLYSLARYGFVTPHPRHAPIVRRLAGDEILDPDDFTILDPALVDFVHAESLDYDPKHEVDRWDGLRAPLTTGLVALGATLGLSEPELATSGLVAPGLLAAVPAVLRALAGLAAIVGVRASGR